MPDYIVKVHEVHIEEVRITANSMEEAKVKVNEDEGEGIVCNYSYTLDPDVWEVEEAE